ncbi:MULTISPECIES: hypothetical protein [Streptomyces]|uniref:hypothetical protein n=1 Tax=Streptomyces TaxID=1883 RepID=UPI00118015B5|nr:MULTISPECIES: hypothetical protein [unclassified Streptomyces]MYW99899.1 hypothetical protein [Streptomyces sp. SID8378]
MTSTTLDFAGCVHPFPSRDACSGQSRGIEARPVTNGVMVGPELLNAAGGSVVIILLGLLLRPRKDGAGMWDVLHELARGRTASGMERERRATLSVLLRRLPDRRVQVEDVGHGRRTVIGERADTASWTR